MQSMTGRGRGVAEVAGLEAAVEATSVNRRGLEVSVSLPRPLAGLEPKVEERVRAVLLRGAVRVEVTVRRAAAAPVGGSAPWDEAAVEGDLAALARLAARHSIHFQPSAELLWQVAVRRSTSGAAEDWSLDLAGPAVEQALGTALDELRAMRAEEGSRLAEDLRQRLGRLEAWLAEVRAEAHQVPAVQREALLRRLREAALNLDLADERVLRELALFADRADVSEECTRLASHLAQMAGFLASSEPVGRKLEFLLQEMHREWNTIGSKSPSVAVTRLVVEAKTELERMREQAANVE